MANYSYPKTGAEAEKTSLLGSLKKIPEQLFIPSPEEIARIRKLVLKKYNKCPTRYRDVKLKDVQDFAVYLFEDAEFLSVIKRDSKPGVPYVKYSHSSDNASLIKQHKHELRELLVDRIMLLCSDEPIPDDPREWLRRGFCDPFKIGVKGEPHPERKSSLELWRLIWALGIIDQGVERFFNHELNAQQIQNHRTIPSKAGLSFSKEYAIHLLQEISEMEDEAGAEARFADIGTWDLSLMQWLLDTEVDMRVELNECEGTRFERGMRRRHFFATRAIACFSDGTIVVQNDHRFQKSGRYTTTSGNSMMRVFLAMLLGALAKANGDDTIETTIQNAKEKYAKYGFRLKVYETEPKEFCSKILTPEGWYPADPSKLIINLLSNKPKTKGDALSLLVQFNNEMYLHPNVDKILEFIGSVGWATEIE